MTRVYYNEFDPFAAAWLRELMADDLIPKGEIDERSIADVQPADLAGFDQCHFFAGIGGWPLALDLAGWHGPVWTGSCPCQPFSVAGKRAGKSDPRHLWPEFRRLIAECQPPVVFGEQVASKAGRDWLAGVRADLEGLGYGVGASDLCAASVGAPHIRQRLWWVGERLADTVPAGRAEGWPEPGRGSVADGGAVGGVADPGCQSAGWGLCGPGEGADADGPGAPGQPERSGGAGRLADSHHKGLEGRGGYVQQHDEEGWADPDGHYRTGGDNPWASAVWHPCRDGKTRRIPVEPALFPLADGLPNRVGTLRGAGNAIVPQVGAAFVKAYMEVSQ